MSGAERNLVAALRAELAAIDPVRPCDRAAESIGLGSDLATREPAVARLAIRLERESGRGASRAPARLLETRGWHVPGRRGARPAGPRAPTIGPDESAGTGSAGSSSAGTESAGIGSALTASADVHPTAFDWDAAPEHCRIAFLRGRFLARGSLSLASARTHLEFVVRADEAPVLARRLTEAGLPASWRVRRGRGVVTWKSADTVGTFLRRIGAGAALLELEARQVSRAVRGDLNRILNAESANLQRAVAAAGRQLEAIGLLEADGRLAKQSYTVRLVAEARRETPEATLTELAERLEIHRSGVQRALERLEHLALHDDDGQARPPRARPRRSDSGIPTAGIAKAGWPSLAVRTSRAGTEEAPRAVPSGPSRESGPLA